jgi:hypothetical protein
MNIMAENKEEVKLKECQLCHQMFPKEQFFKRKDRNGEYNWSVSYCGSCNVEKTKESKIKNPEHYRNYNREYNHNHYHNNKDKYKIYQKRYYYKKLSPEKQVIYKEKLQEKYPDIVEQVCV